MNPPSKLFLEKLLLKLKTGNSRSIHLNALPGRFARLDLHELINLDSSLHLKFIRLLLQKTKFDFKISVDFKAIQKRSEQEVDAAQAIIKKLNSLFYQQQDEFLEHGSRTFAIGYPLLIKRDASNPQKILKAPLVIWYLDVQKDLHQSNTWYIKRNEEQPLIFNEVLRSYLETHDQIKVDDILPYLEDQLLSEDELVELCAKTLEKLGSVPTEQDLELKILPGTNRETIERLTKNDAWIRWSGIFGLYKTQKQSIIEDIETLIREPSVMDGINIVSTGEVDSALNHFSAVELDPSQESILNGLKEEENIILQGPPGTGKSQSLTALISDSLIHGKTCLVVCEKKTALDVIYSNLTKVGLEDYCIMVDDVYRDRKKVVDKVRHLLETRAEEAVDFRHYEYEEIAEEHQLLKTDLSRHISVVNTKCFGDHTIVGLIANTEQQKRNSGWKKMTFHLSDPLLSYDYAEYLDFRKSIDKGAQLFARLPGPLPFDSMLDKHFLQSETTYQLFPDLLFIGESISRILDSYKSELDDAEQIFNSNSKSNRFRINVASLFSKRYKRIKASRAFIHSEYEILKDALQTKSYFSHTFSDSETWQQMDDILPDLKTLNILVDDLYANREHFDAYSEWRKFYLKSSKVLQVILSAISSSSNNIDTKDWLASFDVWYKTKFIGSRLKDTRTKNGLDSMVANLTIIDDQLRNRIPDKVRAIWDERQKKVLNKRTINNVKQLYNYRRNKKYGRRNSLRKIVHQDFELFNTAFPIIMVNPVVCSSIMPLRSGICDRVVFDEASQLRIEDNFAALLRGSTKVISGDKHQMPPSSYFMTNVILMDDQEDEQEDEQAEASDDFLADSTSLLEYGMDTDFKAEYLDFHYRSRHPDLIAFSNAAFYGNRLVAMPPVNSIQPMVFVQVDGTYLKNRTNVEEAAAIAGYISHEINSHDGVLPSVGIATLNINQRNFIWEYLTELAYSDETFAHKLNALIEAGLFVKNLENIQGDERDIILISTTFGPNPKGDFRQSFGPLTQAKGYQLLNVIITRAKQQLAVFTSIPKLIRSSFQEEISEKGNTGKAIFYAYLTYVEAVANQQLEKSGHVLDFVAKHCPEKPYLHEQKSMPLFLQLIYAALFEKYENDVVHNYRFGGFLLELAIVQKGKVVLSIQTSHFRQPSSTAYRMFLYKKEILDQHGIPTYFVDAIHWFNDWQAEEKKLMETILTIVARNA